VTSALLPIAWATCVRARAFLVPGAFAVNTLDGGLTMSAQEIPLRYGINPHQTPARAFVEQGTLPLTVLNGAPGYINILDLLHGWQLVKELKAALGIPAAASYKHVSPAGAAVAVPLSDTLKRAYFVDDLELTPLATAYARARGADRMSSFGDAIALSNPCDLATARMIAREVSDCIIAPGYQPQALDILRKKHDGKYLVMQIDPSYTPPPMDTRVLFGITLEQRRNDRVIGMEILDKIVTRNTTLPDSAKRDLLVATIALKYTQSNSVSLALDGQIIGLGAGQQSRIHCTRLAADKARNWFLRQHPVVLSLPFKPDLGRAELNNAVDQYLLEDMLPEAEEAWLQNFAARPKRLNPRDRKDWLKGLSGVSFSSDAFFPFRDSIECARQVGVKYIVEPGGAVRDDVCIQAADEYDMVMAFSGLRLFTH
jgi:phosphoribosylaminoimidazolecarboxamide formyltransferase/IMP cyclohydrolase